MVVTSLGVITPGCNDCKMLKKRLSASFSRHDIELQFEEIDFTTNEEEAMKVCEEFGFDDIPAFEVNGKVFRKGFDTADVEEVVNAIRNR